MYIYGSALKKVQQSKIPMLLNRLKNTLFIVGILFLGISAQAQDPIYSQYYAAPLQLNPAFAGNTLAPFITINYRNQWSSIPTAYQTYSVSYSQFFEEPNVGVGFMATADDAGEGLITTNHFHGFFAYRLQVNRDFFLKLGVEAGFMQTTLDWNRYIFYDQIDPIDGPTDPSGMPFPSDEIPPNELNKSILDISTGILAYSRRFYGGFTLKHINTPDDSFLNINDNLNAGYPMRAAIHGGLQLPIGEGSRRGNQPFISPNILYTWQRDFAQLNIGAYASLGPIFAGAWFRNANNNGDAAILLAGFQRGILKVGYSYDFTISQALNTTTGGSHEISVILNFDANQRRKQDYNDCLELFR